MMRSIRDRLRRVAALEAVVTQASAPKIATTPAAVFAMLRRASDERRKNPARIIEPDLATGLGRMLHRARFMNRRTEQLRAQGLAYVEAHRIANQAYEAEAVASEAEGHHCHDRGA